MNPYRFLRQLPDPDAGVVQEWIDSLDALAEVRGSARARRVLLHVLGRADELGLQIPAVAVTDYINTIPAPRSPRTRATRISSGASATSSAGTRR